MDLENKALGRVLAETVRLPNLTQHRAFGPYLRPGIYNENGGWIEELTLSESTSPTLARARIVIEFAGVNVIWGTFSIALAAGQVGALLFTNVPGTAPVTTMVGEWDPMSATPRLSQAVFELISAQRGIQSTRIVGRNTSSSKLPAAAGFILSPNANPTSS